MYLCFQSLRGLFYRRSMKFLKNNVQELGGYFFQNKYNAVGSGRISNRVVSTVGFHDQIRYFMLTDDKYRDEYKKKSSILNGTNARYLEDIFNQWLKDPNSIDPTWNKYFQSFTSDAKPLPDQDSKLLSNVNQRTILDLTSGDLNVDATIRAYQTRGHLIADTDPLGIQNPDSSKLKNTANLPPAIVVRQHLKGLNENDLNREYSLPYLTFIGGEKRSLTLREILIRLNNVYCGHLGLEYTYLHDLVQLDWLREKFEKPGAWDLPGEHRIWSWINIMKAVSFEAFLARKYPTEKRFGLEGCEAFISSMMQCIETSAEYGVETVAIGMAHRGRLNTLVNVCKKPMHHMLTQFNPTTLDGSEMGDVKYHLGTYSERPLKRSEKLIKLVLMPNPSHLESVDPLVVGRIRAEQVEKNDQDGQRSLAILVHGDASYAGQGVCFETMHFTNLPEYKTGGVVHLVINNQIGFTTDPRYSRSSAHCTDVARVVNAPIFHVHADDPDLVTYCSKVAGEYRATFHNDVVLDIVGYRRNGHNEMDEPMLTQPLMYKRIKEHPNVLKIYTQKLLEEGVLTDAFVEEKTKEYLHHCETEFEKAQSISSMQMSDWHDVPWSDFFSNQSPTNKIPPTGIDDDVVEKICLSLSTSPDDIEGHTQVFRMLDRRKKLMESRQIDWGMGEGLAFLSLLREGYHVRLSGEDVERGTFSHRMHIIHDQSKDMKYKNCLQNVYPDQALYTVSNSSLSEYGVCGFELGYSSYNHNTLTIWEAQFGDFVNTCQVIIDNYLCSGQTKWGRQVGLVLFLPHGMEGQGPEHSSARLERFLQLCDDDYTHLPTSSDSDRTVDIMTRQLFEINWIVCNITTPANLFHVLRRQILMPFRKPLIIMTPKSLLRHPMAVSNFMDIAPGTNFIPLIPDKIVNPSAVEKVLLCSGKVYYDMFKERREQNLEDKIAIVRIEQLCPFPYHSLIEEMSRYPKSKIVWFQEEHKNQGAYQYVRDRIALALGIPLEELNYVGRLPSASSATGSRIIHQNEYANMMKIAMDLN